MIRQAAVVFLLLFTADAAAQAEEATVYIMPEIPTEAEKILALKLAYELNGRSMVGFGRTIDLSGPYPAPPPPLTNELMPVPKKQEKSK